MRVLIIRPEREATALATALAERGHTPVIAPLFRLEFLHPPAEFSAALAACQAVLLTSANGARALRRSERAARPADPGRRRHHGQHGRGAGLQRRRVGVRRLARPWPTSSRQRLDPKDGPLVHVVGTRRGVRFAAVAGAGGLRGQALRALRRARGDRAARIRRARRWRRARSMSSPSSRRARHRCSPRWSRMRGWRPTCVTSPPSPSVPAALAPAAGLPFKAAVAAERPTRQAVLDEIDRLAEAPVQGQATMSDASEPLSPPPDPPPPAPSR